MTTSARRITIYYSSIHNDDTEKLKISFQRSDNLKYLFSATLLFNGLDVICVCHVFANVHFALNFHKCNHAKRIENNFGLAFLVILFQTTIVCTNGLKCTKQCTVWIYNGYVKNQNIDIIMQYSYQMNLKMI
jgi:hypothetical protein